jgi:hypothetical protein
VAIVACTAKAKRIARPVSAARMMYVLVLKACSRLPLARLRKVPE